MLNRKVLILVGLATLAVGIIACGQGSGLAAAPEPTPTLAMTAGEVADRAVACFERNPDQWGYLLDGMKEARVMWTPDGIQPVDESTLDELQPSDMRATWTGMFNDPDYRSHVAFLVVQCEVAE